MNIKLLIFLYLLCCINEKIFTQNESDKIYAKRKSVYDTLFFKNGQKIVAKIIQQDSNRLVYNRWRDNTDYIITISEVETIKKAGYKYELINSDKKFYAEGTIGFGIMPAKKNNTVAFVPIILSTGYQFKPHLGLGVSIFTPLANNEEPLLSTIMFDYRLLFKRQAFYFQYGLITPDVGTVNKFSLTSIKTRPGLALSWQLFKVKRKIPRIFRVNFAYFNYKTTFIKWWQNPRYIISLNTGLNYPKRLKEL